MDTLTKYRVRSLSVSSRESQALAAAVVSTAR